jgi:hypothetical protein
MRPVSCPRATYQRRQPEQTVLFRAIATHLPTFLARTAAEDGTGGWPAFGRREFEAYLKCGRLEHGLLRVQCERCGDTTVVAFSCRGRGFCPAGGGRRMSERAAHLVERLLPRVPIRQWVFTVPVRYQLALDAGLTRAVRRVFLRTLFGRQRRRAARRGLVGVRSGSVTAIQRLGGSANLNVHFHALLFDGVDTRASPTARPVFHRLPPPTDADIAGLLARLQRRVRRLVMRRGHRAATPGAGVVDGELGRAAAVPLQTRVARRLHGAVARAPGTAGAVGRPRAAAPATAARLSRTAGAAIPMASRDCPEGRLGRRAGGRGGGRPLAVALGAIAPAGVRV